MHTMTIDLAAAVPNAEGGLLGGESELLAQATPCIVLQTLRWAAEEMRQEASHAHLEASAGTWYYVRAAAILQTAAESIEKTGELPR